MKKLARFFADESGASAAEYALILGIVGIGIVASVGALRDAITNSVQDTADCIAGACPQAEEEPAAG